MILCDLSTTHNGTGVQWPCPGVFKELQCRHNFSTNHQLTPASLGRDEEGELGGSVAISWLLRVGGGELPLGVCVSDILTVERELEEWESDAS